MRLFNKTKCGNRVKYKNKKCGNVLKQYKVDLKENQLLYSMRFNFAHQHVKPLKHWLPITDMITSKPDHLFRSRKM